MTGHIIGTYVRYRVHHHLMMHCRIFDFCMETHMFINALQIVLCMSTVYTHEMQNK